MAPWLTKSVLLAATFLLLYLPARLHPGGKARRASSSRRGRLETLLLALHFLGFLLPLVWVATPWLAFADRMQRPAPFLAGLAGLAAGLLLLHETHAALGANWSITLEIREGHRLVTEGIYRRVRHPMYLALLVYAAGLALVTPNWVAGPLYLVAVLHLVALRLGPEERMMREAFGQEYEVYRARTRRLLPGLW
ncbi:MAG: protein-S-isoprenylcysteine O-methyltransferase [Planctomycetaceae bacterium]